MSGAVERAIRRDLRKAGESLRAPSGLAMAVLRLARLLDDPLTTPRDAATVVRELRATMETLGRHGDSDSGSTFVASLLTSVDNPEDGPADKGRGARQVRGGVGDAADAVAAARRRRRA